MFASFLHSVYALYALYGVLQDEFRACAYTLTVQYEAESSTQYAWFALHCLLLACIRLWCTLYSVSSATLCRYTLYKLKFKRHVRFIALSLRTVLYMFYAHQIVTAYSLSTVLVCIINRGRQCSDVCTLDVYSVHWIASSEQCLMSRKSVLYLYEEIPSA